MRPILTPATRQMMAATIIKTVVENAHPRAR